jgi:hypothetical protein
LIIQTEDILSEMGKFIPGLFYIFSQCRIRCGLFYSSTPSKISRSMEADCCKSVSSLELSGMGTLVSTPFFPRMAGKDLLRAKATEGQRMPRRARRCYLIKAETIWRGEGDCLFVQSLFFF